MRFQLPLALLAAAAALPAAGCATDADPADPGDVDDITASLELENGGFDTSDEEPLFGDAALYAAAELEADAAVSDALATTPELVELDTSSTVRARNVIVVWGRIPVGADGTGRVWNGTLELSRGAMLVRRVIAFEDAADAVLARVRRDAISFTSATRAHVDGLALTVYDPAPADPSPLVLTYTSADAAVTYTFELSALADGPIVVDAGDGNKMIALTHLRRRDACDHGFVRGRWRAMTPNAGHYAGLLLDSDAQPVGHIRGIYGKRRNGQPVFFGKFINREGGFRGIVRGTYDAEHFDGRWLDRTGDHGAIHGRYFPGETLRAGFFLGRWAETSCAQPDE